MPDSSSQNQTLAPLPQSAAVLRDAFSPFSGFPVVGCHAQVQIAGQSPIVLDLTADEDSATGPLLRASSASLSLTARYTQSPGRHILDEAVTVKFSSPPARLRGLHFGWEFSLAQLSGFRLHPVPFRVGLDGVDRSVRLEESSQIDDYAEGWILENGERGLLVMRLPSGSARTCFVPACTHDDSPDATLQIGSFGPDVRAADDGPEHRTQSYFLIEGAVDGHLELPLTRYIVYEGGWEEGVHLFRESLVQSLPRIGSYRPSPVTYNTFHDFGPAYTRQDILSALPRLQQIGFGMLHLDPGWETAWGSAQWDESNMGAPRDLIEAAARHGLKVGLWTSMHTRDVETFDGLHTLDAQGRSYLAEEFGPVKLWGVCPISRWKELFLSRMRPLVEAGVCFVNSDFHDWPWSGESCHAQDHTHKTVPTRLEWVEAVNDAFCSLRQFNPDLTVEMHDHVESGEYRTPVWYLYGREGSFDEKWAYEFMWTTHDDLLSRKLFALYHLRKAEPIPLYLHMNMMSDNANALAFWYVASCVNHIGVGGALKAPSDVVEGYTKAIALYNAHADEMTSGEFVGLDELTHVHLHPERHRAFLLAFNLEDRPATRMIRWRYGRSCPDLAGKKALVNSQEPAANGSHGDVATFAIEIPPRGVAFASIEFA